MSILSAMQAASLRVYGQKPQVFFGSTSQSEMEFCDWANEVARDVMESHSWQALSKIHYLQGDGVTEEFDLPSDYEGMQLGSRLQTEPGIAFNYMPVPNMSDYLAIKQNGFAIWPGIWTIYGNKMHVYPAPTQQEQSYIPYQSKNIAVSFDGTPKREFTSDTDESVLPDRLLTLGIVWRWRENKKYDTTGDMEAFVKALNEYSSKDKGSRSIRRTHRSNFLNARMAYPFGNLG